MLDTSTPLIFPQLGPLYQALAPWTEAALRVVVGGKAVVDETGGGGLASVLLGDKAAASGLPNVIGFAPR